MTHLLAEWILLCPDALVVIIEGFPEDLGCETHLLGESLTALEALHETTTDVVLAVPFDLGGCLTVEHKTDGIL